MFFHLRRSCTPRFCWPTVKMVGVLLWLSLTLPAPVVVNTRRCQGGTPAAAEQQHQQLRRHVPQRPQILERERQHLARPWGGRLASPERGALKAVSGVVRTSLATVSVGPTLRRSGGTRGAVFGGENLLQPGFFSGLFCHAAEVAPLSWRVRRGYPRSASRQPQRVFQPSSGDPVVNGCSPRNECTLGFLPVSVIPGRLGEYAWLALLAMLPASELKPGWFRYLPGLRVGAPERSHAANLRFEQGDLRFGRLGLRFRLFFGELPLQVLGVSRPRQSRRSWQPGRLLGQACSARQDTARRAEGRPAHLPHPLARRDRLVPRRNPTAPQLPHLPADLLLLHTD